MSDNSEENKRILIIANTRYKGGASGGDKIYESFMEHWPNCRFDVWTLTDIDYKPFVLAYLQRICLSCIMALTTTVKYDMVYSSSDFLPDSIAGFILKLRGNHWVAGFFLNAFKYNPVHYYTQKIVKWIINKFSDQVIVTNPTMYHNFPDKKKTWINGVIETKYSKYKTGEKKYDAVFVGRIHKSKGIDELIKIWELYRRYNPKATLAIIGDGDLGWPYLHEKITEIFIKSNPLPIDTGICFKGFMDEKRFEVYQNSKVVLYPVAKKYDHFSMSPVEAMTCGCPMVCFDTPVMRYFAKHMGLKGVHFANETKDRDFTSIDAFVGAMSHAMKNESMDQSDACLWASQFDSEKQSLRVYEKVVKNYVLSKH